jgi:hypothetical protein
MVISGKGSARFIPCVRVTVEPSQDRVLGYRSLQALKYIRECVERFGKEPTYTQIRKQLDLPSNEKVRRVILTLEHRGYVSVIRYGAIGSQKGECWGQSRIRLKRGTNSAQ